ncbi:MAG: glycogen debranching protein GlgX [Chromatiaceae bacterium]|jgi:glycogen operon protein|nr:glycogen debranching protein GlgX [Chromatiaceae bacterium]
MGEATQAGRSHPLGATVRDGGVGFSVYSEDATGIELLLFDGVGDRQPSRTIPLDPRRNRTYHYWHVFVPGLRAGQLYAYRAQGPFEPARGLRFDPSKVLLDPYGRCVAVPSDYDREAAASPEDNTAVAMKSVVADLSAYDWEGDEPLQRPFSQTVIYEMHLKGFTRHPSSGLADGRRGTYTGLIDKIPYLKDLGVTAVELLPIFHFDPLDAPPGRVNYWGYAPVSFFAPHPAYGSKLEPLSALDELRDLVKALHRAGIEVILDVVYNHTAEGDERGPTLSFRGLQNDAYYILEPDRARYANYTGTGNTLNGNHPVVRRLILDSLRYWVKEMHVDGFRFDLASILSRDESGRPLANPPVLFDIETDPVLAGTKLIAEAWDAAGLYQVGSFVGDFWKEWNGRFRDDLRSFVRGDRGTVSALASRMLASPDIYGHEEREPEQSINFVTCHDGFTLNDLVSYDGKHNEANGEDNRDGADDNRSWNGGVEGPSDDPEIESLRLRQIKNFHALNLLAFGTPMILMGDELRRTQLGNNNAYCQDNELGWLDWTLLDRNRELHRFLRKLIALRLGRELAAGEHGLSLNELLHQAKIQWHGVRLGQPDWGEDSHSLACTLRSLSGRWLFHLIVNAYWEPLAFELPEPPSGRAAGWCRLIDTARPSPHDIAEPDEAEVVDDLRYLAEARSLVLLLADNR